MSDLWGVQGRVSEYEESGGGARIQLKLTGLFPSYSIQSLELSPFSHPTPLSFSSTGPAPHDTIARISALTAVQPRALRPLPKKQGSDLKLEATRSRRVLETRTTTAACTRTSTHKNDMPPRRTRSSLATPAASVASTDNTPRPTGRSTYTDKNGLVTPTSMSDGDGLQDDRTEVSEETGDGDAGLMSKRKGQCRMDPRQMR
jgi:hypothetical protein